jgi:leader peptidase (prepilin peptidase) / N-methyltransferase
LRVVFPWLILLGTVFALGCVVGSFLNVCIYRLPRERSIVAPPSHCPQCGVRLTAIDLVPLLSFLALGRKCRTCGGLIGWRYFLVELLTGVVFLWAWFACGPTAQVLACWIFAAAIIAVIFTDLDHMIIPDGLVWAALLAGVLSEAISVLSGQTPLLSVHIPGTGLALPRVVAGGILGVAVFVGVRGFSELLFRREGMGLGDVKLAGAIGAMLGPGLALLSFGLAIATGAALGVLLMVFRLRRRMEYLPFGPFLAVAALAVLFAPEAVVGASRTLYERWLGLFM